jgi:hypothetical protein
MRPFFIATIVAANLLCSGTALAEDVERENLNRISKCEADLWEGVSAVYYLVADSGNLARHAFAAEFQEEVKEFEEALSVIKHSGHLHGALEQAVTHIEETWIYFRSTGEALVEQALKGEKAAAADLAKFWQTADAIDEHIDEIIEGTQRPET